MMIGGLHLACLLIQKAKATKKIASKKRKYPDVEIAHAVAVAEAAERAERGGARSGVVIADQQLTPA